MNRIRHLCVFIASSPGAGAEDSTRDGGAGLPHAAAHKQHAVRRREIAVQLSKHRFKG
jgi:hypothetical protein